MAPTTTNDSLTSPEIKYGNTMNNLNLQTIVSRLEAMKDIASEELKEEFKLKGKDIKQVVASQKTYKALKLELNKATNLISQIERIQDIQILNFMDDMGVERITLNGVNLAKKDRYVASCSGEDYDKFLEHVKDHPEHLYLVQRRISSAAALEAVKLHGEIPGISVEQLRKLSKTKA